MTNSVAHRTVQLLLNVLHILLGWFTRPTRFKPAKIVLPKEPDKVLIDYHASATIVTQQPNSSGYRQLLRHAFSYLIPADFAKSEPQLRVARVLFAMYQHKHIDETVLLIGLESRCHVSHRIPTECLIWLAMERNSFHNYSSEIDSLLDGVANGTINENLVHDYFAGLIDADAVFNTTAREDFASLSEETIRAMTSTPVLSKKIALGMPSQATGYEARLAKLTRRKDITP